MTTTDPTIQVELTQHDFSRIYYALTTYLTYEAIKLYLPGAKPEYIRRLMKENKETANHLIDQVHAYRRSHVTKDDAGVVHLHLWNPKEARLFTYTCRDCGVSMTIEADDGHPAHDYWMECHKCPKK